MGSSRANGGDQSPLAGAYVTPDVLAEQLGISMRTLYRWHAERRGPPRVKLGNMILYRVTAVHEWLAEHEGYDR